MRRRICIIADALDEHYAGVHTYARELIVNLLTLDTQNEYTFIHQQPNPLLTGQREIIVPLHRANPADVFYRKIFKINTILRRERFDIVHDLFHLPPYAFRRTASCTITTIHDLTPILEPKWHSRMTVFAHRLILPRVFGGGGHIIADSQSTANDIQRLYGRFEPSVSVVPLGTRVLPVPPVGLHPEYPFLLFVGTLEPRKNLPVLVEAYERVRRAGRSERLVLIGKQGWRRDETMQRIAASPYARDIVLKGFMEESMLAWHYHHAAAFVYPSLYEGFGLPVLEAMACGCPVVTSDRSSLPEVVGDAGLMASPDDADALAERMLALLTQPGLAQALAEKSRERARGFTWERTARLTLDVYRTVLAQRGEAV